MSYCSIKEAWGDNFPGSRPSRKHKKRIENFDDYSPEADFEYYQRRQHKKRTVPKYRGKPERKKQVRYYPDSGEFNSDNQNIERDYDYEDEKQNISADRYRYNFSRGIDKLPEHQGNRRIVNDVHPVEIDSEYQEDDYHGELVEEEQLNTYQSSEENENITEEEGVYEEQRDQDEYFNDRENNQQDRLSSNHNISFILDKLNTIMNSLEKGNQTTGSVQDMVLFILTGIFIIFVMDYFFRVGKNIRN